MSDYNRETGEYLAPRMPPEIAKAIVEVKKRIRQLGSDERNEHARYNYVSVDKFYAAVGPLMAEAGLALLINEASSEVRLSDGERKTPWLFCSYELTFLHESGAMSSLPMSRSLAMPINGPQTYGAAQSYIEKQFLRQVFKVPTGEKDADETAQDQIAPEMRSGSATARRAPAGYNGAAQRQQAAPAPSAAAEAIRRFRELAASIDATESISELDEFENWLAFEQFEKCSREAANSEAQHQENVDLLRKRAERRRAALKIEADRMAALPI